MTAMSILIAGETSGRVRDAFRRKGHRAISCDFLPTKVPGPHIVGNAFDWIDLGWDLIVAHPTCTYLTVAAAWCYYHPDDKHLPYEDRRPHPKFPDRRRQQDEAAEDFMRFIRAKCPRVAVENPVGVMSTRYRKPNQIIQPYYFGDDASKKTCLWLEGDLQEIEIPPEEKWFPPRWVENPRGGNPLPRWSNQTDSGQNRLGPSEDRWAARSETYIGIAEAMAEAWG